MEKCRGGVQWRSHTDSVEEHDEDLSLAQGDRRDPSQISNIEDTKPSKNKTRCMTILTPSLYTIRAPIHMRGEKVQQNLLAVIARNKQTYGRGAMSDACHLPSLQRPDRKSVGNWHLWDYPLLCHLGSCLQLPRPRGQQISARRNHDRVGRRVECEIMENVPESPGHHIVNCLLKNDIHQ